MSIFNSEKFPNRKSTYLTTLSTIDVLLSFVFLLKSFNFFSYLDTTYFTGVFNLRKQLLLFFIILLIHVMIIRFSGASLLPRNTRQTLIKEIILKQFTLLIGGTISFLSYMLLYFLNIYPKTIGEEFSNYSYFWMFIVLALSNYFIQENKVPSQSNP